jgi:hypothetical protein
MYFFPFFFVYFYFVLFYLGLVVSYSIDLSTSSVCSIAGNVVSFTGSGDCRVVAKQNGNINYNSAAPGVQIVTVRPGSQSVN